MKTLRLTIRNALFCELKAREKFRYLRSKATSRAFRLLYNGLAAFESLTDSALERIGPFLPKLVNTGDSLNIHDFPIASIWEEMVRKFSSPRFQPAELVEPDHVLMLKAVRMESPGFWEFFGKLNPLEIIRQFLNDMHERRNGKQYREAAEERTLYLKNLALENQIVRARIGIAKSLGATNADLTPLLNELIVKPLNNLAKYRASGQISTARIASEENDKERERTYVT